MNDKSKSNENSGSNSKIRQRDKDGFRMRAACVCVMDNNDNRVLLITSKRQIGKWMLPGGGIEIGEDGITAAKREALEEAGVVGTITQYLGCFEDVIALHRTLLFVLNVHEELVEWDENGRERKWFGLYEAHQVLAHSKPTHMLCLRAFEEARDQTKMIQALTKRTPM